MNERLPNILIVDDMPANTLLLSKILTARGYHVRPVLSGKLALQAARTEPPDLILLDINMPEMNGYEVCEQLKADAALKDIPVIFISALDQPQEKVKAFRVGGVDYVTKPFQLEEVQARVETHLKIHSLQRRLGTQNENLEQLVAEIEEARVYAENIVETVREPLVVLNADLKVLTANQSFYKTFSVAPEDTIGNFIYELGNRQWDIPALRVLFAEILPQATVFDGYEVEHDFPDIGHKVILLNAREISRKGIGSRIILLAMQDITQDKHNQQELLVKDQALMRSEKMASIGILAAGVAHEINNPLGFITSNLRILDQYFTRMVRFDQIRQQNGHELSLPTQKALGESRETLDIDYINTEGVDLIKESLVGAERVRKIVLDLKNFSRIDDLEQEAVTLDSCLESALNICCNELNKVATIRKEYESLPVLCHPGQLNQVFLNLLLNAGQAFTTPKPGEILLRSWHDAAFVYASVSDTGKGIPEEIRGRIFDPFFTTKDVGQGTGLGLSISCEIVKKHQGELLVESVVGKGTTFTVKLPRTGKIL